MPDISMCKDKSCPVSKLCHRFTATPSEYRQSYVVWPKYWKDWCKLYWANDKVKTDDSEQ